MSELIARGLRARIGAGVSGLLVISSYSYRSKLHKRQEAFRNTHNFRYGWSNSLSDVNTRIFNQIYRAKNAHWYLWDHDVLAPRFMNIIRANRILWRGKFQVKALSLTNTKFSLQFSQNIKAGDCTSFIIRRPIHREVPMDFIAPYHTWIARI